ncbi:hypothetical protein JRO89_XS08G0122500 [Xanthoceras sorbifolium]|uniref:Uncharacterized protein n=1 Tax=Xanthoceras sorbifolium TaxID=99658 RepID=A0ABQ8HPD9_9ROSI|nr:hypothetical protein JRO89_XS08G0122500 [Xanthoceras sorbifolium]
MGKVSPKERGAKNSKHKRRLRSSSNRYLKPGALAQLRYSKASATKSCTDLGKKRIALLDAKKVDDVDLVNESNSVDESPMMLSPVDLRKQNPWVMTPKTPREEDCESDSRLESLPMDLLDLKDLDDRSGNNKSETGYLYIFCMMSERSRFSSQGSTGTSSYIKILCHLHHDQLKAVFHVSRRIRKAVVFARQIYFNYTTPDRSRQEMLRTMTPLPTEHWPFASKSEGKGALMPSPHTPKAPRHGPRPPSRIKPIEMRQIAAVLFQDSAFPSRYMVSSVLPKPLCKSLASNRVLFYEDELCQAVAQNKLR